LRDAVGKAEALGEEGHAKCMQTLRILTASLAQVTCNMSTGIPRFGSRVDVSESCEIDHVLALTRSPLISRVVIERAQKLKPMTRLLCLEPKFRY
jgi:hypothetical protein